MQRSRAIIYKDKEGETELKVKIKYGEMLAAIWNTAWFENLSKEERGAFVPRCDWCGNIDTEYMFFPELGHKVSCKKCAKSHNKIVKWYVEDTHTVFNSIILFVITYDIGWTENDYDVIDEFFKSKGHNEIKIRELIRRFKNE